MIRLRNTAITLVSLGAHFCFPVIAQDNPILRERLEQKIIEDLSKHDAQDKAWYHEKSVDRQKRTGGKILGRTIKLASWTEQSKTWVWLDEPASNLSLDLNRLELQGGRIQFSLTARAGVRFRAWGRIPKLVQASAGGKAKVIINLEGSAAIGDGQLQGCAITKFTGSLNDLRFNNKLAHPFEDLIKDALNDYVEDKNEKLRRSLEKAIDRVRF